VPKTRVRLRGAQLRGGYSPAHDPPKKTKAEEKTDGSSAHPQPIIAQGAGASIVEDAISIVPTGYPHDPHDGTVTVQNYVTINTQSADFRAFESKIEAVLTELRKSNAIAGEVRDKLIAEMNAGMAIIKSPKPDRRVIDVWLVRPLKYVGDKGGGAVIGALATTALGLLLKMMGVV
jgi:hypothetical protein